MALMGRFQYGENLGPWLTGSRLKVWLKKSINWRDKKRTVFMDVQLYMPIGVPPHFKIYICIHIIHIDWNKFYWVRVDYKCIDECIRLIVFFYIYVGLSVYFRNNTWFATYDNLIIISGHLIWHSEKGNSKALAMRIAQCWPVFWSISQGISTSIVGQIIVKFGVDR